MDNSNAAKYPTKQINKISYQVNDGQLQRKTCKDTVITEQPLLIRLTWCENDKIENKVFTITMRTPGDDNLLILGLLHSESVIKQVTDVKSVTLESNDIVGEGQQNEWLVKFCHGYVPDLSSLDRYMLSYSSCGLCGTTSLKSLQLKQTTSLTTKPHDKRFCVQSLLDLADIMALKQPLFNQTGGVHGAALFNDELNLLYIYEDIGRHNAVDKVIGAMISQVPIAKNQANSSASSINVGKILLVSGRISFEIVQKVIMADICVLIGVGAPSELAIKAAKQFGLTLIGFANATGLNVYHGDWRLHA